MAYLSERVLIRLIHVIIIKVPPGSFCVLSKQKTAFKIVIYIFLVCIPNRLGTPELSREATSTPIDGTDPIPALLSSRERSTPNFIGNGFDAEVLPSHFSGAVPKQMRNPIESLETDDIEYLQQKLTHLKLRLDEAAKTIQAEREYVTSIQRYSQISNPLCA